MDSSALVGFVRGSGLGVLASRGPDGEPQAALVGIAATDRGEIVFDTSTRARKVHNIEADPRVALVVGGWEEEVTMQIEGEAEILGGAERDRCLAAYVEQYPDGRERARNPQIGLVRVLPRWVRLNDYRPGSFGSEESSFGPEPA